MLNEDYKNISDPVQRAIVKFESHPSISLIKNKITNENSFKFEPVSLSDIQLEILQKYYIQVLRLQLMFCIDFLMKQ